MDKLIVVDSFCWMSLENPDIYRKINGDGSYRVYNGDGKMDFNVVNGKIEGLFRLYDSNIGLVEEGEYMNGLRTGWWIIKDYDRRLNKGEYKDGKKVGIWKSYYADGLLMSTIPYEDGQINGTERSYYKNGKVQLLYELRMDRPMVMDTGIRRMVSSLNNVIIEMVI